MFENLTNKQLHTERVKYGLKNIPVTDTNRSVLIKELENSIRYMEGDSEDLEQLTNKQLREEMLKWGLPNVPVTQSSRSLLIRKLRKAMQDDMNQNKSLPVQNEAPPKVMETAKTKKSPITKRRSSGQKNNHSRANIPSDVSENKFDKKLEANAAYKPNSNNTSSPLYLTSFEDRNVSRESTRRSTTPLSMSGILATSYVHEVRPVQREIVEMDIDDEEVDSLELDEDVQSVEMEESPYFYQQNNPDEPFLQMPIKTTPRLESTRISLKSPALESTRSSNASDFLNRSRLTSVSIPAVFTPPQPKVPLESPRVRFQENINTNKLYPNLHLLKNINEQKIYTETEQVSENEVSSEDEPILINSTTSSEYNSPNRRYENISPVQQRKSYYSQNNSPPRRSVQTSIRQRNTYNAIPAEKPILKTFPLENLDKRYHIKQILSFIIAFLLVAFIFAFFF